MTRVLSSRWFAGSSAQKMARVPSFGRYIHNMMKNQLACIMASEGQQGIYYRTIISNNKKVSESTVSTKVSESKRTCQKNHHPNYHLVADHTQFCINSFQDTCFSGVLDSVCQANVQRADQVWGMCTPERHCVAECTASTCTTRKLLRHVTGNQLNLFAKKIELYSKNKKFLTQLTFFNFFNLPNTITSKYVATKTNFAWLKITNFQFDFC